MLAAYSETDQPGWDSPQKMQPVERPQDERHLVEDGPTDDEPRQNAIVNSLLGALDEPRRE
jgi:hypothetical protein